MYQVGEIFYCLVTREHPIIGKVMLIIYLQAIGYWDDHVEHPNAGRARHLSLWSCRVVIPIELASRVVY